MIQQNSPSTEIAGRELIIERNFDAPPELVFDAWTDPQHIGEWWGPMGFTTTTHEIDVREGGIWRFIMHGPDGVDYHNKVVYIEITRPKRLIYAHVDEAESDAVYFQTTLTFEDLGGKTKLNMRMVFKTAAELEKVVKEVGALEGAHQTLERLEAHLATR